MKRWFHPAFEVELIDAALYLNQQRRDLGREFLDEVESAVERIMQNPSVFRPGQGEIRRYLLSRFPYIVRYRLRTDENLVEFLSIIHGCPASRHGLRSLIARERAGLRVERGISTQR